MKIGIAWNVDIEVDAYELYRTTRGVVAHDATTIVVAAEDADEGKLKARGVNLSDRRWVEYADAGEGWFIRDVQAEGYYR